MAEKCGRGRGEEWARQETILARPSRRGPPCNTRGLAHEAQAELVTQGTERGQMCTM